MRYLVVVAHPDQNSFCAALNRTVCQALERAGHEVDNLDLYAEGFDPVLNQQEWTDYHSRDDNQANVRDHVTRLQRAEGLIFVFPTWWSSMPAILKGWLDRVWLPHVVFALPENGKPIQPLLQNIRHIGGVTTCGAPWLVSRLMGEAGRRIILRGLRALCHKSCKKTWLSLYKIDETSPEQRSAFLHKIENTFQN